jgi:ACS family hexuronate transporter-like MFS transporter
LSSHPPSSNLLEPQSTGHYRWIICFLLFVATTINYIDRQILSLLKPILDLELGWTNEQFAYVNSVFQGAYGIGLLGVGWFIDRIGTKIGYAISVTIWSIAAFSHALVGSVAGFRYARIGLGIGESGNFPAAVKATAEWFPRKERAFSTSLFNAGTMAGAVIAPGTIPYIARTLGWRWAFIMAGVAGFIWLVFWLFIYRLPESHKRLRPAELAYIKSDADPSDSDSGLNTSWLKMLHYRQTWGFLIAKFLCDPVWWFFLIWLPDYFHKAHGLDLKNYGPPILVIYSIAIVVSITATRFSDYLVHRGWSTNKSRKVGMLTVALLELPVLLLARNFGTWGAVAMIGLACGAHQAWAAHLFTSVSDMFPKKAVATIVSLGGAAACISGILFPIFTGRLLDQFTHAGAVKTGYEILFAICGCSYLAAFALNHLLARRFEPIDFVPKTTSHSAQ